MLATLGSIRGVAVLIAPSISLHDGPQALVGRTTLRPSRGGFTAWTDILVDRSRPVLTVEALGHEFGHVAEAACLGQFGSMSELRTALRRRADRLTSRTGNDVFETPFPVAIGKVIVREWQGSRPSESRFDALVSQFGLSRCRTGGMVAGR